MAVKAEIFGAGAGVARIRVTGINLPDGDCTLQIQRNQGPDSYLGAAGRWQPTPDSWLPVIAADMNAVAEGIEFTVGPQVVDPIVNVQGQSAFRLTLKTPAEPVMSVLVLSTQHQLMASSARGAIVVEATPPTPTPPSAPEPKPEPVAATLAADPTDQIGRSEAQKPIVDRDVNKGSKGGLAAAFVAIGLLLAAAGGGYLYWQKSTEAETAEPPAAPKSTREILQAFMNGNPDMAAILAKAEEMKAAGNLEAALYLYRRGADRGDAGSALQLGRLYDPADVAVVDKTMTKSSDTAAFWYGKAADAGLAEAQRQLGALLVQSHAVGSSEFDNGLALLQKAAAQGDEAAAQKLKELGK